MFRPWCKPALALPSAVLVVACTVDQPRFRDPEIVVPGLSPDDAGAESLEPPHDSGVRDAAKAPRADARAPAEPGVDVPAGCVEGTQRPCGATTAVGACRLGTRTCINGAWGECEGAVFPEPRQCGSTEDLDCDGKPDDTLDENCECRPGAVEPCDTHPGLDGVGPCRAGTRTCEAFDDGQRSRWGACEGAVAPARGDSCAVAGDDANCNGIPNDGCECVEGETRACGPASDEGICERGVSTCVEAKFGACVGAVLPAARDCSSSADNDCDGRPDDTLDAVCACRIGATEACGAHPGLDGNGACRAGLRTCVAGPGNATSSFGPCEGSVGPEPRRCNSVLDNDCDGLPDNTLDATCTCIIGEVAVCDSHPGRDGNGACRPGTQVCVGGPSNSSSSFGPCAGAVGPAPADSCQVAGDDADCDGLPNGGCECIASEGNAACSSDPAAPRCDATGKCSACRNDLDCALVAGRPTCDAGVCVAPSAAAAACSPCASDAECGAAARCVVPSAGSAAFCFPLAVGGACTGAPFTLPAAITAPGGAVTVCLPRLTTCPALADFGVKACADATGAPDDTACGVAGANDGVCLPAAAPELPRCSVPCLTNADCPAGSCASGACRLAP